MEHIPVLMKLGELNPETQGDGGAAYFQRALAIQAAQMPNDLTAYAGLTTEAASLLARTTTGRPIARGMIIPLIDYLEQVYGEESPELVPPLMALGKSLASPQDPGQQIRAYKTAIDMAETSMRGDRVLQATIALEAGRDVLRLSRSTEGRSFLERAYKLFEEEYGLEHEATATAAMSLGEVQLMQGRYGRAKDYLATALAFFGAP